ncbi:hypothetical protein GCM10018781_62780 [Kitasatospora indigofera]|uniref:Imm-5-like domain-containing protein n=1 Tax=Kitasatospora indigofera TaxID=67307 RepID=A0A919GBN8_9ACTN|nr:hypothetical protein [Kitasatospora indigofera]GHH81046.1 hypothetical protein GCM10018781_62780 [Kitasatospora indigofera]
MSHGSPSYGVQQWSLGQLLDSATPLTVRDTKGAVGAAAGTETAGPFPQAVLNVPPGRPAPVDGVYTPAPGPITVVGRADPGGPVDRVDLWEGRWAGAPGEIVLMRPPGQHHGVRETLGNRLLLPGAPPLTIVGFASSISQSAGARVTPGQVAALHPAATQLLLRFTRAGTEEVATGDRGSGTDRQNVRMDEVTISEEDRRQLGAWAADCAERVLHLFEADAPADTRPREAIEGIRRYARGEIPRGPLRPLAHAALAAAREAGAPAATAAARAAGYAAATPYIHALASPHQSNHVLAPAVQTARARELAADGSSGTGTGDSCGDLEIRRAIEHAPPAVRGILAQLPARGPGRSRAEVLRHRLDAALRD